MQTMKHYIFSPSENLLTLARNFIHDDAQYCSAEVWSVVCHDRSGDEQTREEIEAAFWALFVARQIYDDPEPLHYIEFRERCLAFGINGCWTVTVTKSGGLASELIDEAKVAVAFLAKHGL